jgi:hypothetical protein
MSMQWGGSRQVQPTVKGTSSVFLPSDRSVIRAMLSELALRTVRTSGFQTTRTIPSLLARPETVTMLGF